MFKLLLLLTYVQSIFGLDITQYCPNNPTCDDARCWLSTPCRYSDKCIYKEFTDKVTEYSCSCNYKDSNNQQVYQTPSCSNTYGYVKIIDNNNLYCLVGKDSVYYPSSPDQREGAIWCKGSVTDDNNVFKIQPVSQNKYVFYLNSRGACTVKYWRRRTYDARFRIECDQLNNPHIFELVPSSGDYYILKDNNNQYCFSDGITGIRCRWSSGTPFKVIDTPYHLHLLNLTLTGVKTPHNNYVD